MDKAVGLGPDIPRVQLGGSEWLAFENWLGEKLLETYQAIAKEDTSWEQTLALRGQASFIAKMLDFRNTAAILTGRE